MQTPCDYRQMLKVPGLGYSDVWTKGSLILLLSLSRLCLLPCSWPPVWTWFEFPREFRTGCFDPFLRWKGSSSFFPHCKSFNSPWSCLWQRDQWVFSAKCWHLCKIILNSALPVGKLLVFQSEAGLNFVCALLFRLVLFNLQFLSSLSKSGIRNHKQLLLTFYLLIIL